MTEVSPSFVLGAQFCGFISGSQVATAAGTSIQLVNYPLCITEGLQTATEQSFNTQGFITAFATSDTFVAYAERLNSNQQSFSVRILDVTAGNELKPIAQLELPKSAGTIEVSGLHFSGNSKYLIVLMGLPYFRIHLYDAATWKLLDSSEPNDPISQIAFNPLRPEQFSSVGDGALNFWTIFEGHTRKTLKKRPAIFDAEDLKYIPTLEHSLAEYSDFKPIACTWLRDHKLAVTTDQPSLVVFDAATGNLDGVMRVENVSAADLSTIVYTQHFLIMGGRDSVLRWFDISNPEWARTTQSKLPWRQGLAISAVSVSPDHKIILVHYLDGTFSFVDAVENTIHRVPEFHCPLAQAAEDGSTSHAFNEKLVDIMGLLDCSVAAYSNGHIVVRDYKSGKSIFDHMTSRDITAVAASPGLNLLAVASSDGVVSCYYLGDEKIHAIFSQHLHQGPVDILKFSEAHPNLLASNSIKDGVVVTDIVKEIPIGFFPQLVVDIAWTSGRSPSLLLLSHSSGKSIVQVYEINQVASSQKQSPVASHSIPDMLTKIFSLRGSESVAYLAGCTVDRQLKLFGASASKAEFLTDLSAPPLTVKDHDKPITGVLGNRLFLISWAEDGLVNVYETKTLKKNGSFKCHDSLTAGVKSLLLGGDMWSFFSAGSDGLIRSWQLKHSKSLVLTIEELVTECRNARPNNQSVIDNLASRSIAASIINEEAFTLVASRETKGDKEKSASQLTSSDEALMEKAKELRAALRELFGKNQALSPIESLPKEDFIVDSDEIQHRIVEAESEATKLKNDIRRENLIKKVLRERYKAEFCDSMQIPGKKIRSFRKQPRTHKKIEVTNYPLRKLTDSEIREFDHLELQLHVDEKIELATSTNRSYLLSSKLAQLIDSENAQKLGLNRELLALVRSPQDLNTNRARKNQQIIMAHILRAIKTKFNQRFDSMIQTQLAEKVKIDDRNSRIKEIIAILGIEDELFDAVIDDEITPERFLEVRDEEISAKKYVNPEEARKLEERRRAEELRAKASQDDSYQRGLKVMMDGRLEDKTEDERNQELAEPPCYRKPIEEQTESEKQINSDYEAKLQAIKEDQEKRRKALEAELHKLQGQIVEIAESFDNQLYKFFEEQLELDMLLKRIELQAILYSQSLLLREEDDGKEKMVSEKLDKLNAEKSGLLEEIPNAKQDLEDYREEYETAVKKDKDVERIFKKDFAVFDFHYDTLAKIFKDRTLINATTTEVNPLDPFADVVGNKEASEEETQLRTLAFETDCPEGFPRDSWEQFVDLRDRKISCEREVQKTYKNFARLQRLVTGILDESERIRIETENMNQIRELFMEYKFQLDFNVDHVFCLKQGQVEVPQTTLVVDYKDAMLIPRAIVEKVNHEIVRLGQSEVEALTEMKNYRKGIHLLQWENSVLDFQAEDLSLRARDIQLLRMNEEMQEYLRSGNRKRVASEIAALERRLEYMAKVHNDSISARKRSIRNIKRETEERKRENQELEKKLETMAGDLKNRNEYLHSKPQPDEIHLHHLKMAMNQRRLGDLITEQDNQIRSLQEELIKLRNKTYPSLPPLPIMAGKEKL